MDERAHLDDINAGGDKGTDPGQLLLHRNGLLFHLQAIPEANLMEYNAAHTVRYVCAVKPGRQYPGLARGSVGPTR